VQPGDAVEYRLPEAAEPPVDVAMHTLYEDDTVLAVAKSGDLPCHPGGRYFGNTLWSVLRRQFDNVHLVNRLDRETSGVVLIAKEAAAASALMSQFAGQTVAKSYLALVYGAFPPQLDTDGVLVPDAASEVRKKRAFVADPDAAGEATRTIFTCLDSSAGLSLIRAVPATGRLHQIRATLCSLGFPLVGDKLYGPDDRIYLRCIADELTDADRTALRMGRQALHAYRLVFNHPADGRQIRVTAPLPADLQQTMATAGLQAGAELQC
jgi:23S rRNA pseudouridine955/2504/2580 synthase/23S rRNA pseudouridine1911/1915/1917 synthase